MLIFEEQTENCIEICAANFDLTRREPEILAMLAEGKT